MCCCSLSLAFALGQSIKGSSTIVHHVLFQLPHQYHPLLLPPTNSSIHPRLPGLDPEERVHIVNIQLVTTHNTTKGHLQLYAPWPQLVDTVQHQEITITFL